MSQLLDKDVFGRLRGVTPEMREHLNGILEGLAENLLMLSMFAVTAPLVPVKEPTLEKAHLEHAHSKMAELRFL